jgi:hypothetical protein
VSNQQNHIPAEAIEPALRLERDLKAVDSVAVVIAEATAERCRRFAVVEQQVHDLDREVAQW